MNLTKSSLLISTTCLLTIVTGCQTIPKQQTFLYSNLSCEQLQTEKQAEFADIDENTKRILAKQNDWKQIDSFAVSPFTTVTSAINRAADQINESETNIALINSEIANKSCDQGSTQV